MDSAQYGTKLIVAKWSVGAKVVKADGTTEVTMKDDETLGLKSFFLTATTDTTGQKGGRISADRLAPGMKGEFGIQVDPKNKGLQTEVAIDYKIYISQPGGDATAPSKNFKMWDPEAESKVTGTKNGKQLTPNTNALDFEAAVDSDEYGYELASGTIPAGDGNAKTSTICWEWPYETDTTNGTGTKLENDALDTSAGAAASGGAKNYTITVVMTQGDPTKANPTT